MIDSKRLAKGEGGQAKVSEARAWSVESKEKSNRSEKEKEPTQSVSQTQTRQGKKE